MFSFGNRSFPCGIPAFQNISCMFLIELAIFGFLHVLVIFTNVDSFSLSFSIPTERQTFQFTHKYISFFFFFLPLEWQSPVSLLPREESWLDFVWRGLFWFSAHLFCLVDASVGQAIKGSWWLSTLIAPSCLCEPCWNISFDKVFVYCPLSFL